MDISEFLEEHRSRIWGAVVGLLFGSIFMVVPLTLGVDLKSSLLLGGCIAAVGYGIVRSVRKDGS